MTRFTISQSCSGCSSRKGLCPSRAPQRWPDTRPCPWGAARDAQLPLWLPPELKPFIRRGGPVGSGLHPLRHCAAFPSLVAAEAPSDQHPADGSLRLREAPVDLNATSFCFALDELERLRGIPLLAPRTFHKVARQRRSATNAAVPPAPPPPPLTPRVAPQSLSRLWRERPTAAAADAASGEAPAASAGVAAPAVAFNEPAAAAASAARAMTPARSGLLGYGDLTSSSGSPPPVIESPPGDIRTPLAAQAGGKQGQAATVAATTAAMPVPAPLELGATGRGAVRQLRVDPSEFPVMPPRRLAPLLGECATAKVPVRLSVLQSYADAVSRRASELAADELVTALDGLSRYGFRSRHAPSPPPPPSWADRILVALVAPGPKSKPSPHAAISIPSSTARTAVETPPAVSGLRRFAHRGRYGSSDCTDSSSSSSRSGSSRSTDEAHGSQPSGAGHAGPGPLGVAALSPARAVQLAQLVVELQLRPPPGWAEDFLCGTAQLVPRMTGCELVRLLRLLPALRAAPGAAWWEAVLDTWPPLPLPPPPPLLRQLTDPAGTQVGSGGAGRAGGFKDSSMLVPGADVGPRTAREAAPSSDCRPQAAAVGVGGARAAAAWDRDACARGVAGAGGSVDERPGGLGAVVGGRGGGGWTDSSNVVPSLAASEVRSAVLYGLLVLGRPQGTGSAALAPRIADWALDALYGMAQEVLGSGQLAGNAAAAAGLGSGAAGRDPGEGETALRRLPPPRPGRTGGGGGGGGAAAAAWSTGAAEWYENGRQPPSAAAIARALAALPVAVSQRPIGGAPRPPAGCRLQAVLAVLVASLEPRLGELPGEILLDLLRGFAASRLHPGPRFLRLHAMMLKRRAAGLPPRELLLAARCYSRLGLPPRGGLRAAVLRAREELRREAVRREAASGRRPSSPRLEHTERKRSERR